MSKIRLAAILIVIATVLVAARNYFAKDDPLLERYELCLDTRADESLAKEACSEVLMEAWLPSGTRNVVLKHRAYAYRKQREFEKAIADLDEAVALKPDDANAYEMRSGIYLSLEDLDRAEQDYQRAVAADPTNIGFIRWWVKRMSRLGYFERALAACEHLALAEPENKSRLSCKIMPLLKLGRTEEAIALTKQSATTVSGKEKAGAYFLLGRIYLHLDVSKAETLAAFEKWNEMELEESEPLPALFLAATYFKFGDEVVGARHISDVVQHLSQDLPDGWSTLKGRVVRSFEPFVYRGAIEHYYAGLAYSMIREYDRAKHEYDLFIKDGSSNAKKLLVQIMVAKGYVPSAEEANTDQRMFDRGLERYMAHNGRHFSLDALID